MSVCEGSDSDCWLMYITCVGECVQSERGGAGWERLRTRAAKKGWSR